MINTVSAARSALLTAVEDIQSAATALDDTDAVCAKGHGVAARVSYRAALPLRQLADTMMRNLPTEVANYRAALTALGSVSAGLPQAQKSALLKVVVDGRAEATALAAFHSGVSNAWEQYDALDGQEALWIYRAVTPWYRSDQEGADAYAVLVLPLRDFLTVARDQLRTASGALAGPSNTESATLQAADAALAAHH